MVAQTLPAPEAVKSASALTDALLSPLPTSGCPTAQDADRLTAVVNSTPIEILAPHQHFDAVPVAATVTAAVRLTHEDLVAALYLWAQGGGVTYDELADGAHVQQLIVEAVVGRGMAEVAEMREEIIEMRPGTDVWLDLCRARVRDLYSTDSPRR